jgi:DNA-directed RNA polymerase II subunit RPB2
MGKQAISFYANNFDQRIDTVSQILWYPQKPLVTTKHMDLMKMDEYPAGINAIVAIACYTGYTQEDANLISQGFIDRGGMRSTHYRQFTDEQKKLGNHHSEEFELPDKDTIGLKQGSYKKLGEDGIVNVGEVITTDDIVISKTIPIPGKDDKFMKRDHSVPNRNTERGIVDRVLVSTNPEGHKFTKIRVRSTRIPELGDKYSSMLIYQTTSNW